jgi:hypothetical protein
VGKKREWWWGQEVNGEGKRKVGGERGLCTPLCEVKGIT